MKLLIRWLIFGLMLSGVNAHATIIVGPGGEDFTLGDPSFAIIESAIESFYVKPVDLLYKSESLPSLIVGTPVPGFDDPTLFESSYDTSFVAEGTADYFVALIDYVGGPSIGCTLESGCYLSISDGAATTISTYIFDISTWDGVMGIEAFPFWAGPGSISNIAIWAGTSVPAPATLLLFGLGLIGLSITRKRIT